MKKARYLSFINILLLVVLLSGCKKHVQIFEEKPVTKSELVSVSEMARDWFYVKDGTKFAGIYMPAGNAQKPSRILKSNRVLYFINDEEMLPIHYKGEVLAYKSADISLLNEGISLERFKDLGYSIGVYGGYIDSYGYYHFKKGYSLAVGSNAANTFEYAQTDEIRIVSVNGQKPIELIEPNTGIFMGLEKDGVYTVEFYVGSYYYAHNFVADTHFLGAYEYYRYDGRKYIEDTKLSYMTFNTPEELKSGYYNVNGSGLFLYHEYRKGNVPEDEDLNVGYYNSEQEQILQYTKQYNLCIPIETRDLAVEVGYGLITDALDENCEVGGYLISPEGTVYEMKNVAASSRLEISLTSAMPGDWTISIYPRSLEINGIDTINNTAKEDSVCEDVSFEIEEDKQYQAVYADISGNGNVYGIIIAEDGRTYQLDTVYYKDENNSEKRYLIYRFPFLSAGKYNVKIYHYKSETCIDTVELLEYNPSNNNLIIK